MLAVEGFAKNGAQVIPDEGAVERVGEGLCRSASEETVFYFCNLDGDPATCGVAVEDFGVGFT
jgi:hypothetical protein